MSENVAKLTAQAEALRKQFGEKMAAARKLQEEWAKANEGKNDPMPQETADKINQLLGETDGLKVNLANLERMVQAEQYMSESAGTKAAHLGWREAGPGEGDEEFDPQAWREVSIKAVRTDRVFGVPIVEDVKVRFHIPLAVQKKGYSPAFEAYMRKGLRDMGPNDYKTLSEGVDSAGGFLVPEDYHIELIRKIATMATIRANARVATTSRDMAKWPRITYTTDDKYTSGVRMTWTGEQPASSTAHRVTDPVYGLYSIPVHTAMASLPLTNDLIEDSAFDVLGISSDLLAEAFALGENDAFIAGNGIARPMGITTQVDGDGPASVKSGSGTTLTADGLIDLAYALPAQYERNAKWYMSKATEKEIRKLVFTTTGEYVWPVVGVQGGFAPAPRELLGFPVVREEFMPAIAGNAYPIIFGDLTGYLVLDRVGLSVQRLSELYAETNITVLLGRKRVGGQCVEPWRMRAQKITT